MSEGYFSKPLLLPSNGFEYEKICYIKPPTFEFLLFNEDRFFNDSELEKQISFIRKYTTADPLKLYTFDFYYILANFHFYLHDGEKYKKPVQCLYCKNIQRLNVDLAKLPNIKILSSTAKKTLEHSINDMKVFYRRRKIIDNLEFAQKTLNEIEYPNPEVKLIEFLKPQIETIVFNGEEVTEKEHIQKILKFANKKVLLQLYEKITEKDFGLDDRVMYNCKSCKNVNYTSLYDDIEMSNYYPVKLTDQSAKVFFENLINANRFRFISYGDMKDIPLQYFSLLMQIIKEAGLSHIAPHSGI